MPPRIESDRRGRGGVERFDARRHGDAPARALAKRRGQARPLDARRRVRTARARVPRRARGRRSPGRSGVPPRRKLLDRRPQPQGDLEQGGPGGPAAPGMKRVRGLAEQHHLRNPERRGRADHRADVLRVLKRDEQACSPPARDRRPTRPAVGGTWTSKSGACVPALSSWRNRSSVRRYQSRSARGGGGPSESGHPRFDLPGHLRQHLGHQPRARQNGLAVLADAPAAEKVAAELEHRVRLARHLAHRPAVGPGLGRRASPQRDGAGLTRQPLVDHEPAVVGRPGDLVVRGRRPAGTSRRASAPPRRSRRRTRAPS